MFQNKKLKSFFNGKTVLIFALSLFLGLSADALFGRYLFSYSITETFTEKEAAAKINRRVHVDFSVKSVTGTVVSYRTTGTVVSYRTDENGETYVSILFDVPVAKSPTTGEIRQLDYGKKSYHQFVTEISESEGL